MAEAYGKVILVGEHAVVYGVPAVAMGIGRGAKARVSPGRANGVSFTVSDSSGVWDIEPGSELAVAFERVSCAFGPLRNKVVEASLEVPVRAGLGSSACLGVAIVRALMEDAGRSDAEELMARAMLWEQVFHGSPSGIDVAVAISGGCIRYEKGVGAQDLALAKPVPICVGDTGVRSSTREMVDLVRGRLLDMSDRGQRHLQRIEDCVSVAQAALPDGDWLTLGEAMNRNQRVLDELGAGHPRATEMLAIAAEAGAIGGKITGSGGGGCVIALAPDCEIAVLEAWRSRGYSGFAVASTG